jgi:hypothetical protein
MGEVCTLSDRTPRKRQLQRIVLVLLPALSHKSGQMYSDHFWACLEGMAAALGGNRRQAEESLQHYEEYCLSQSESRRAEIREQLVSTISALARLETRLAEHDARKNEFPRISSHK